VPKPLIKPVDPKARYVCPQCGAPKLQALSFFDAYTGSAANMTTLCGGCGTLRRYRESKLEKAAATA
jgi:RNase P subunit RPR2